MIGFRDECFWESNPIVCASVCIANIILTVAGRKSHAICAAWTSRGLSEVELAPFPAVSRAGDKVDHGREVF